MDRARVRGRGDEEVQDRRREADAVTRGRAARKAHRRGLCQVVSNRLVRRARALIFWAIDSAIPIPPYWVSSSRDSCRALPGISSTSSMIASSRIRPTLIDVASALQSLPLICPGSAFPLPLMARRADTLG